MQAFLDFLPVIIFYVAYKMADIYVATSALIVSMFLLCAITYFLHKSVKPMLLLSTLLVVILGSITLILRDPIFIQWKPTLISFAFAFALAVSTFIGKQTLIERVFSAQFCISKRIWNYMTIMWVAHFIIFGVANYLVFTNLGESTWVNFKLFGSLLWTLLFIVIQVFWLTKAGVFINDNK
jgi:intracellular septation protein